jgi:hypothetical protein
MIDIIFIMEIYRLAMYGSFGVNDLPCVALNSFDVMGSATGRPAPYIAMVKPSPLIFIDRKY